MPTLDFEPALNLLATHATSLPPPRESEILPLLQCLNRVLATAVSTPRDQPPFDRSTRDGYALRSADLGERKVIGLIKAGDLWSGPTLTPGQAIEIMTGAPVPRGADAVAMLEHVTRIANLITPEPSRTWTRGENIVPRASEAHAGQPLIPPGTLITAAEIALAAACGLPNLTVFRQPTVAIIATGDELRELGSDAPLAPQQIYNSNSHALAALVLTAGAKPLRLPIARDTPEAIAACLELARTADLILFSGGVSMGQFDLVEDVLLTAGAQFQFTGVRMQPGKPVVFGHLPESAVNQKEQAKPFFGLPGNPISTQVTFHAFVEPLLRTLAGSPFTGPRWALATLAHEAACKPALTRLLPAHLSGTEVRIIPWQGSGDLAANARANCYAQLPPGTTTLAPGTTIRILLR